MKFFKLNKIKNDEYYLPYFPYKIEKYIKATDEWIQVYIDKQYFHCQRVFDDIKDKGIYRLIYVIDIKEDINKEEGKQ